MSRGIAAIAVAIWVAGAYVPTVTAEPAGLRWTAPTGCPDRAWVETRISSHLGRAMRAGEHANVSVSTSDAGYQMTVRTRTPGGSGQVGHEHADCAVLADLAALIIAMAIDPMASGPAEPAKPAATTQQGDDEIPAATLFAVDTPDSPLTRQRDAPVQEIQLWARGFIAADRGSLPGVAPGFGFAAAATRAPWRLEASFSYLPEQRTSVEEMPQSGGQVSLFVGALRSCFQGLRRPIGWSVCGLIEVGDISARSFGVTRPGSGRFVWLAFGGATTFAIPLSNSVYFQIDVQASANLRRPRFVLPAGTVHQPDSVSGRVAGGLELRFR